MEIVERGTIGPFAGCILTRDVDGPFLDTKRWVDLEYGYIHVPFVEEMGRAVGMVPAAEVASLQERLEAVADECAALRTKAEALASATSLFLDQEVSNGSAEH